MHEKRWRKNQREKHLNYLQGHGVQGSFGVADRNGMSNLVCDQCPGPWGVRERGNDDERCALRRVCVISLFGYACYIATDSRNLCVLF